MQNEIDLIRVNLSNTDQQIDLRKKSTSVDAGNGKKGMKRAQARIRFLLFSIQFFYLQLKMFN